MIQRSPPLSQRPTKEAASEGERVLDIAASGKPDVFFDHTVLIASLSTHNKAAQKCASVFNYCLSNILFHN
jgi:hypothetical protein